MRIRQFEALRLVVIHGTTKEASIYLGMGQSAVSRLVSDLEREVGFSIFDRKQGRLVLTPEGRLFYAEVAKVLVRFDRIKQRSDSSNSNITPELKIFSMPALAFGFLPPIIEHLVQANEDLLLSVQTGNRTSIEDQLINANRDVAIVTLPIENETLEIETQFSMDCVCILPKSHRLAAKPLIEVEDLADEPFISKAPESIFRYRIDELFSRHGIQRSLRLESQSTVNVCHMVASGLGVSIVHGFLASYFSDSLLIKPFRPVISVGYGIVTNSAITNRQPVTDFIASAVSLFASLDNSSGLDNRPALLAQ